MYLDRMIFFNLLALNGFLFFIKSFNLFLKLSNFTAPYKGTAQPMHFERENVPPSVCFESVLE